jgi:hypothetical protein
MSTERPNFYLADLPPEARLTASMVTEACRNLKTNREKFLLERSTPSLIQILNSLAEDWLSPDFPYRRAALAESNIPRKTLARGLDAFFRQLTAENFEHLLVQELGDLPRLDRMIQERHSRVIMAMAHGPELLVHITAGNIPAPALMAIVLGLLVRSAQFVKCATGTSLIPRLFAHSLYDRHPKLGACLEIAEWPGGSADLESALFAAADCVTATGSDETLAAIRRELPPHVRFVPYGHRVSFGYIAHEALTRAGTPQIVERAADDVIAWNQLGCLSPHLFYVETNGSVPPEKFAELLAAELERREQSEPRGNLPVEEAAQIAAKRDFYKVRAAHSSETQFWSSQDSTAWTVIFEADPQFQLSCLNRFIYVKPVNNVAEALQAAASIKGKVSTVAIAAPSQKAQDLAIQLARWGATRICPLGQMQNPPLTWRHDGRPPLADLVTWTDWEL